MPRSIWRRKPPCKPSISADDCGPQIQSSAGLVATITGPQMTQSAQQFKDSIA
jgi:hypothetical protein